MNRLEHIISIVIKAALLLHLTSYSVHSARDFIIDGLNRNVCGNTTYTGWTSTNAFCDTDSPDVKERISGGSNAEPGRFPSYVHLNIVYSFKNGSIATGGCGGTLIHNDLILTAAHCVQSPDADPSIRSILIKGGCLNIDDKECQSQFGKVFCIHPQYSVIKVNIQPESEASINDLALVQTYYPFKYDDKLQPACLELEKNHRQDTECYAVGRGRINDSTAPRELKYLAMKKGCQLPAGFKQEVLDVWENLIRHYPSATCYMSASKRGNTCQGDSGGPMYCMDRCGAQGLKQYVVGATSFGPAKCGTENPFEFGFFMDPTKIGEMLNFMLKHCHAL